MKNTRHELFLFSFYDVTGMARHLEKMAAKGWMLQAITPFGLRYRRIEPKALRFTACYYPPASTFDPEPGEGQLTLQDFCAWSGWELATSQGQLQIFYTDCPDATPIQTDPAIELRLIRQAGKKVLPGHLLLLLLGLLNMGMNLWNLFSQPLFWLSSAASLFGLVCWASLLIYLIADLGCYFFWLRRAEKASEQGVFLPTRGCGWLQRVMLGAVVLAGVYWLCTEQLPGMRQLVLVYLAGFALLLAAVNGVKGLLRRKKVSARRNLALTLAADVVLALVLTGAMGWGILRTVQSGQLSAWQLDTTPPLTVAQLTGQSDEGYIFQFQQQSSLFLSRRVYAQQSDFDQMVQLPWMEYTLFDTDFPSIRQLCLDELFAAAADYGQFQPMDASLWQADAAWQLWEAGEAQNVYLIAWPGRVVRLETDWLLTDQQMALAGRQLGQT